jgi:hypothetical protein
MEDVMNLTEQDISDWRVRYYKSTVDHDLSEEVLEEIIPLSPKAYNAKYGQDTAELDAMKAVAGVPVTTTAPVNDFTESLRVAAGLK